MRLSIGVIPESDVFTATRLWRVVGACVYILVCWRDRDGVSRGGWLELGTEAVLGKFREKRANEYISSSPMYTQCCESSWGLMDLSQKLLATIQVIDSEQVINVLYDIKQAGCSDPIIFLWGVWCLLRLLASTGIYEWRVLILWLRMTKISKNGARYVALRISNASTKARWPNRRSLSWQSWWSGMLKNAPREMATMLLCPRWVMAIHRVVAQDLNKYDSVLYMVFQNGGGRAKTPTFLDFGRIFMEIEDTLPKRAFLPYVWPCSR